MRVSRREKADLPERPCLPELSLVPRLPLDMGVVVIVEVIYLWVGEMNLKYQLRSCLMEAE
jgi:hypothetical protein